MDTNYKIKHFKFLYIFFLFLALNLFFFSTVKSEGRGFDINNIDISRPFELYFNKNDVIDEGFKKAFSELIAITLNSSDQKKFKKAKLNEIKGMIESFTIKEEKFINEIYHVNLGVSFNKKKILDYFESKSVFPSTPLKKKILFISVILDENNNDLFVFSKNNILKEWNNQIKTHHLLEYILPTDDLEDFENIKKRYMRLEEYDFREIIDKYYLEDFIIALIFKNDTEVKILSKINIQNNIILKNQSFSNIDLDKDSNIENIINNLKTAYEDYWKNSNQINTSIRLPLNIKISNKNNKKISDFEEILIKTDLVYDFFILKFDKDFTYYRIIYNGTPNIFLDTMKKNNHNFNIQNEIWSLK